MSKDKKICYIYIGRYATEMPEAVERMNGVVMNIDRWYELYDVQWGDYLYLKPENRIHIW